MTTTAAVKADPKVEANKASADPRKDFEQASEALRQAEADLAVAAAREKEASKARRKAARVVDDATATVAKAAMAVMTKEGKRS